MRQQTGTMHLEKKKELKCEKKSHKAHEFPDSHCPELLKQEWVTVSQTHNHSIKKVAQNKQQLNFLRVSHLE